MESRETILRVGAIITSATRSKRKARERQQQQACAQQRSGTTIGNETEKRIRATQEAAKGRSSTATVRGDCLNSTHIIGAVYRYAGVQESAEKGQVTSECSV